MSITRREFLYTASTLAVVGGAMAALGEAGWSLVTPAQAQDVQVTDLLQDPPLPDKALGPADAPVTVVEYASMTCPHCAHFHATTYPEIKKRYIDTGKIRFIFREFPLDELAAVASMVARCSDDKYFAMIEVLFRQQRQWVSNKIQPLMTLAKQAGFTEQSFKACTSDQALLDNIEKTRERASQKFGVNSTPTFFINGKRIPGAMTIEDFEKAIKPFFKDV